MTPVSKDVYIDKLDDIINKYSNTYHSTIKIKLINVSTYIDSYTYIEFNKRIMKKILNQN